MMFYFKQYKGIKYLKKIKSHLELNVGIKDQVLAKAECFDSRNSSFHLGNEHELRTFYMLYRAIIYKTRVMEQTPGLFPGAIYYHLI